METGLGRLGAFPPSHEAWLRHDRQWQVGEGFPISTQHTPAESSRLSFSLFLAEGVLHHQHRRIKMQCSGRIRTLWQTLVIDKPDIWSDMWHLVFSSASFLVQSRETKRKICTFSPVLEDLGGPSDFHSCRHKRSTSRWRQRVPTVNTVSTCFLLFFFNYFHSSRCYRKVYLTR